MEDYYYFLDIVLYLILKYRNEIQTLWNKEELTEEADRVYFWVNLMKNHCDAEKNILIQDHTWKHKLN